jgi:metal-responsive CopG/Arc/MetJ family transcriptional regulator
VKEKVQDDKILLRLPSSLTAATDQVIKEQLQGLNRSEFIRRAVRFTLDNMEQFKSSEAATASEKLSVESVEKINAVREQYDQLLKYTDKMQTEPGNNLSTKQLAYLVRLVGTMIFRMADPA